MGTTKTHNRNSENALTSSNNRRSPWTKLGNCLTCLLNEKCLNGLDKNVGVNLRVTEYRGSGTDDKPRKVCQ